MSYLFEFVIGVGSAVLFFLIFVPIVDTLIRKDTHEIEHMTRKESRSFCTVLFIISVMIGISGYVFFPKTAFGFGIAFSGAMLAIMTVYARNYSRCRYTKITKK